MNYHEGASFLFILGLLFILVSIPVRMEGFKRVANVMVIVGCANLAPLLCAAWLAVIGGLP